MINLNKCYPTDSRRCHSSLTMIASEWQKFPRQLPGAGTKVNHLALDFASSLITTRLHDIGVALEYLSLDQAYRVGGVARSSRQPHQGAWRRR